MNVSKEPIVVLFVSSNANKYGGGESYLLQVVEYLDRRRFRPVVVLPDEGDLIESLRRRDAKAYVVPMRIGSVVNNRPWNTFLRNLSSHVDELIEIIRNENVGIVHTNANERIEGALAARISGVHHIYLAHISRQTDGLYQRLVIDQATFASFAQGLSSRVVAVSKSVAASLQTSLNPAEVQVIHNGLDFTAFDARAEEDSDIRIELGLAPQTMLATVVGRLCYDKGVDTLLEAAGQVLSENMEIEFLIIGAVAEADYAEKLYRRTDELNIAPHVHFLGRREDVPAILRQSEIFVLSSRIEGHPYVLLEAMASKCGIVATRCAGVEETAADKETALLVSIDDVASMAESIKCLADNPELLMRLANAADAHVREQFSAKRSVDQLMDVYDEVIDLSPPTSHRASAQLFLRAAEELGSQGLQMLDLSKRVADLEATLNVFRENPLVRGVHAVLQNLRSALTLRRS